MVAKPSKKVLAKEFSVLAQNGFARIFAYSWSQNQYWFFRSCVSWWAFAWERMPKYDWRVCESAFSLMIPERYWLMRYRSFRKILWRVLARTSRWLGNAMYPKKSTPWWHARSDIFFGCSLSLSRVCKYSRIGSSRPSRYFLSVEMITKSSVYLA